MPRYKHYQGDPYWTIARYASQGSCGHAISAGDEIFYFPRGKEVYCNREECGKQESNHFVSMAEDEALMTRNFY